MIQTEVLHRERKLEDKQGCKHCKHQRTEEEETAPRQRSPKWEDQEDQRTQPEGKGTGQRGRKEIYAGDGDRTAGPKTRTAAGAQ